MTALSGMVKSRLADRQFRAGVDLVSSSALNAIAGLAFWFVAARGFDEAVVGVNAAIIAMLSSVENLTSLGMKNTVIRFMPSYGPRARWLVIRAYGAMALATLILTPILAIILVDRVEELALLDSPAGVAAFTGACLVWVVFVLQDSVLVALGKTALIPVANLAYAIAKLALLAALTVGAAQWSIFTAWTLPVVPIILWVNIVAFRALRTFRADAVTRPQPGIVRFAVGENASTVLNTALFAFLPIFVLAELGESASAFFALAWAIAYNLMLANSNVSMALLAAASSDENRLVEQSVKSLKQMALFVTPAVVGVILFAPFGLKLFGDSYSDGGSTLLRLLALGSLANIPVAIAIGVLRAQRRVARLFSFYALRTLTIGTLCFVLGRSHGLTGVGWGWLLGEGALALLVGVTLLRPTFGALIRRT